MRRFLNDRLQLPLDRHEHAVVAEQRGSVMDQGKDNLGDELDREVELEHSRSAVGHVLGHVKQPLRVTVGLIEPLDE